VNASALRFYTSPCANRRTGSAGPRRFFDFFLLKIGMAGEMDEVFN
jgi:hypothetical protein